VIEIELVGSGGQGVVVAAKFLADAAAKAGYYSQSFASYGALRRGGQVESYVRLSQDKILVHSKMYQPDYLILMDESLAKDSKIGTRIKKGTTVLINTSKPFSTFPSLKECNVTTIDAHQIAHDKGLTLPSGMPIINTTILGAIVELIPLVDIDHLIEVIRDGKIPAVDRNIEAAREAYQRVKEALEGTAVEKVTVGEISPVIVERYPVYRVKIPPCEANCPAGEDIERTAYFIQNDRFEEALENIKAETPFPGICGRVCFHPCETHCNRNQYDEGVAINALERAAFDYAEVKAVRKPEKRQPTGKRVAVIGSGPAGMTCAYYLALLGHEVTVFEALPVAGGIPRFGIPKYRLPKNVVDREIQEIIELGVNIRLNTEVGKDIAFNAITEEYDACFIASGAGCSMKLNIPGEDRSGVVSGIDFLKRVALGDKVALGRKVAVIGGGNTAVDAARTARRLGATEVTIIYRRSIEEMPAFKEEVAAAEKEAVKILYLAMPVQIDTDGNRVSRLECLKTRLGEKDKDGRRRPEPVVGTNFTIDVDTVIAALGETVELPCPPGTIEMSGGVIEVDQLGRTSMAGVFAGGDVVSVSRSVVEAIASGKRAALGIDTFLTGGDEQMATLSHKAEGGAISMTCYLAGDYVGKKNSVVLFEDLNTAHFTFAPRVEMAMLPAETRTSNFDEINLGLSKSEAIVEAERCFHCGHCTLCEVCYISCPDLAISLDPTALSFTINEKVCKACGICVHECPRNAISWEGATN
jgi:2-oxoacid:acceptor oxidoreductase gamma subunit (pyruvate/2-ketoisovalerate family)